MSKLGLSVKEEKAYRRKELNKHVQSRSTAIKSTESLVKVNSVCSLLSIKRTVLKDSG